VIKEEDGSIRIDTSEKLRPDVQYYECENVWGFEYDQWYLIRLRVNSAVQYGNSTKDNGIVCLLIDNERVWRIEQYGKQTEYQFRIEEEYEHRCGFAPCIHLMGVHSVAEGKLIWRSPYLAAKGALDAALLNEQYLQGIVAKVIYPHTVVVGDECGYFDGEHGVLCDNGYLRWFDGAGEDAKPVVRACPKCEAKTKAGGVFGVTTIKPVNITSDTGETPSSINATNALAFITPSTDSVKFIEELIDKRLVQARKIIHVDAETPMTGGDSKTATEAGLNAKARDAFAKGIIDQLFVLFEFGNLCFANGIQ